MTNGHIYLISTDLKKRVRISIWKNQFFFSDSHLAPKFLKVVANSKVGCHFQRQSKPFFYVVSILDRPSKIKLGKRSLTCYKVDTWMNDIKRSSSPVIMSVKNHCSVDIIMWRHHPKKVLLTPAPVLIALSMVFLGMLINLAFSTSFSKRGFMRTSCPFSIINKNTIKVYRKTFNQQEHWDIRNKYQCPWKHFTPCNNQAHW